MISDQSKNYFSFFNSMRYEYFKFFYGKRFDKFDYVIGFAMGSSNDDFEMQTEFWNYYAIAPVFAVLHNSASADELK